MGVLPGTVFRREGKGELAADQVTTPMHVTNVSWIVGLRPDLGAQVRDVYTHQLRAACAAGVLPCVLEQLVGGHRLPGVVLSKCGSSR